MKPGSDHRRHSTGEVGRRAVPGKPDDGEDPAGPQQAGHAPQRRLGVHVVQRGDRGDQVE
jgi:hypothetical protein